MTLYNSLVARLARPEHARLADVAVVVGGSLLMTVAAKTAIPFYPVPLSMQTFVAIGLGLALGPVRGALCVLFYLMQGAGGLPVFAGSPEKGVGLAYMMGPTGGFLLGFVIQAYVAGLLAERGWDRTRIGSMAAALIAGAAIYPTGLLWLGSVIGFDKPVLEFGLYPFILGDIVKAMLAALVFPLAWQVARKR